MSNYKLQAARFLVLNVSLHDDFGMDWAKLARIMARDTGVDVLIDGDGTNGQNGGVGDVLMCRIISSDLF